MSSGPTVGRMVVKGEVWHRTRSPELLGPVLPPLSSAWVAVYSFVPPLLVWELLGQGEVQRLVLCRPGAAGQVLSGGQFRRAAGEVQAHWRTETWRGNPPSDPRRWQLWGVVHRLVWASLFLAGAVRLRGGGIMVGLWRGVHCHQKLLR